MKKLICILFLFASLFVNAQEKRDVETTTSTKLKFSFENNEDLKNFNWNDIKEYASENKPEEIITLEFNLAFPVEKK